MLAKDVILLHVLDPFAAFDAFVPLLRRPLLALDLLAGAGPRKTGACIPPSAPCRGPKEPGCPGCRRNGNKELNQGEPWTEFVAYPSNRSLPKP